MTKKKKGIFSKIKDKFSKNEEEFEDEFEFEEEYEEDFEESEFEEGTGEIAVSQEIIEESTSSDLQEGTNHNITFDSLEKDENEIENLLDNRESEDEVPSIDEDEEEEEDEEEFVATEFKVSADQKEELSELDAPANDEPEFVEQHQEDDSYYEDEEELEQDYEDELYEEHIPKQSVQQKFASFLSTMKNKFPKSSKSNIEFEGGTIDDNAPREKLSKVKMPNLGNLSWSSIVEKTFSPDSRQNIHKGFITCLVIGTSYFTGKLVAQSVSTSLETKEVRSRAQRPTGPMINFRDQANYITKSNLFNTVDPLVELTSKKDEGPTIDENLVCLKANKKSSLGIKLVNTIVLQDSVKSIAAVQVRGKKEVLSIREGDKISTDAQIGKIDRMKLVFKNLKTGECEFIETKDKKARMRRPINVVSKKKGAPLLNKYKDSRIKNVGNNFKIKKKVRDEMLSNISEVLTQARAIQIKNPDGSLAFKMTEVVPGSIYSKLNIQDGDIITGVNGKKFNNLNEIMNLFGKIKEIDQFELSLKRDGVEQNLEYNFE